jgi:HEAT repeat protein
MWELLIPLLPAAVGGAGLWVGLVQRRRRLRAWQEAAGACGLQAVDTSGWRAQLTARAGPVTVRIETCGNKGLKTRIVVCVPGPPGFHDVIIRHQPHFQWARDIDTGDPSFDSAFFIEGPARLVLSLLDAETRRLLRHVSTEARLAISSGTLRAEHMSDENVPIVLPLLLDIGRRFTPSMDAPRRLAENAGRDPEAGVRLRNLLVLIRELSGAPGTIEALRTACSDPYPEMRLRAAQALGAERHDILLDLAESAMDDAVSAEAVATLDRELPFERTRAILDQALEKRRPETVRTCLEALGRRGDAAAVDELAKVLSQWEGAPAATAARALGATGNPAAEPPLLRALQSETESLRVAAAHALGRVGSVAAVLPLQEAAERSWLDLGLRRATQQAIAEIQSRLQGASPGQLSLAHAATGQLSLATDPAGQLSLPPEEPEQPSQMGTQGAGRVAGLRGIRDVVG